MPKALKTVIGTKHKTWKGFCKAVREASMSGIKEAQKNQEEMRTLKDRIMGMETWASALTRNFHDIIRTASAVVASINQPPPLPANTNAIQQPHTVITPPIHTVEIIDIDTFVHGVELKGP
ncbi:hypothetical protein BD779DRAFT_1583270, partial [Infundibulicybe gibba]